MIKDNLTIVIPSKNESKVIDNTLTYLNKQHDIKVRKVRTGNESCQRTQRTVLPFLCEYNNIWKRGHG